MDVLTIIVVFFVFFVLFLMLTSGSRRHRLRQALNTLETERMRLMKSVEHVKLSFYKRQIDEKEAQGKIFEYEEKLRDIESKILNIKEKPLMRTLREYETADKQSAAKADVEVVAEKKEAIKSERVFMANLGARAITMIFIVIIVAAIVVMLIAGKTGIIGETPAENAAISLPMTVTVVPQDGTYPGSTAGMRVGIHNPNKNPIKELSVVVRAPEGSGIRFKDGSIDVKLVPDFESGGSRELLFFVLTNKTTEEGEYVLSAEARLNGEIISTASGKLIVRIGTGGQQ